MMCYTIVAVADDLIVFRNGDVVKAKVLEIKKMDVKYKRASNPQGPTYTVDKTELLSIIYENGEKDMFGEASPSANLIAPQQRAQTPTVPSQKEPIPAEDNASLIARINNCTVRHGNRKPDEKKFKTTKSYTRIMGITDGSILSDENIAIDFEHTYDSQYIEKGKTKDSEWITPAYHIGYYKIKIRNKTSRPIYIDAANSFRIYPDGESSPFFGGVSVTNTTGKQSGGSLGLGAVTNALGIGGVVGSLAQGIGIGGGSNNSTSVTTTESNIIAIPPGAEISMPRRILMGQETVYKEYEQFVSSSDKPLDLSAVAVDNKEKLEKNRYVAFPNGEKIKGMRYYITYSTTPDFSIYYSVPFGFYVRGLFASKNDYDEFTSDDGKVIIGGWY